MDNKDRSSGIEIKYCTYAIALDLRLKVEKTNFQFNKISERKKKKKKKKENDKKSL